jgi:phosphoketolase
MNMVIYTANPEFTDKPLSSELQRKMDAYWRAANYLSVGQIYLYDNPLLKRPLTLADVKHMLLGHWGTTPGKNFINGFRVGHDIILSCRILYLPMFRLTT